MKKSEDPAEKYTKRITTLGHFHFTLILLQNLLWLLQVLLKSSITLFYGLLLWGARAVSHWQHLCVTNGRQTAPDLFQLYDATRLTFYDVSQ